MTVFIIPNLQKQQAFIVAKSAAEILMAENVCVVMEGKIKDIYDMPKGVSFLSVQTAYQTCDIVLTIGGDGTMLHVAMDTIKWGKPMLGINVGRLGFLTVIENDELENLRRLPKKDYFIENRALLQVDCEGENPLHLLTLNDVVVFKESAEKTITLDIYCDEIKVSGFRGDGVVFSTATGSTAYSMSAGGPIVDSSLDVIIMTQICAHIVRMPPMVLGGDRILRVVPTGQQEEHIYLSCDGLPSQKISYGESIIIQKAKKTLPLIQFEDARQLKSIDKKLKGM